MSMRPSGYMPQLDTLRTFAVLLVIIFHWFPTGIGINRLPNGTIGVVIFFVLSGFLITRILLQNRDQVHHGQRSLGNVYRTFFIRRVLRIFPLYYLVITLVWLVIPQDSLINEHPLYYYAYGYNILLQKTGDWADLLSPFWTLSVEEQLYLVWPWIVFLTPKKSFRWIILCMILCGIGFRLYGYSYTGTDLQSVLTPTCFDTFGLGALWAYIVTDRPESIPTFIKNLSILAILALLGFIVLLLVPNELLSVLFQRTLISVLALFIIAKASLGIKGLPGKLLDNRILQYFGRISYGIYVFHMLIPGHVVSFLMRVLQRFGLSISLGYWSHRLVSLLVLLVLASLSWYAFEKPFNELKRYFPQKRVGQLLS